MIEVSSRTGCQRLLEINGANRLAVGEPAPLQDSFAIRDEHALIGLEQWAG